ncbi:two-component system sensor histidine kinase NtrB [Peribacillus asahii]|uniref:two-component system sensor histidine kinase NtrB n=1 Tax=Peribacillus asahii TaxID=228899 RepID=UPI00207A0351|nr:ATP-binding protein [Peribacillus asahii]USK71323.1 PAS domain-containing protein [Peribacillus asahii]
MIDTILNQKMLEILDNISEGCCFLNSKMEVEFINKAGEALLEKPKEEVMHKCQWDVLPKYKETIIYELYNKAYREQTVQCFETVTEYSKIPMEIKVFPNKYGIFLLFNDITKRKKDEEKQRYYDQLKIIAEMAAGVAHEVRNPMTTIKGFLQLMENNEELGKYKDIFQLMIDEVNRVNEIITNFLDLSKEKPNKVEYCNLNDIITTIVPLLETRAIREGKYIKLELGKISKLNIDKNEIRQLLINLVNNSLDAMSKGQSVRIISLVEHNNVILSIQDEGAGIPSDIFDKISVPFVTSKESGTGLGLSICFSIAKRNNAEISYSSSSNGTTFNICFLN